MKFKKIGLAFVGALSIGILTACSNQAKPKNNQKLVRTANLSANFSIQTLDLSKAQGFDNAGNLYDSLLYMNKNHKAVPALASKYSVSNNGKTYTFTIRKNAKFSNGDPITAESFVYSWQRTLNPKTKSTNTYLFNGIKNASTVSLNKLPVKSLGVSAPNKRTFVVNLERPIAYFPKLMTYQAFSPQDKKIVDKYGAKYGETPNSAVFSGPYVIKNWRPQSNTWTFKKNQNYWDKQAVKMNTIHMHYVVDPQTSLSLYQSHKLDFTILIGDQVNHYQNSKNLYPGPYSYMNYLIYNQKSQNPTLKKAFNNINIRKAISLTINRKQISSNVLKGESLSPTGLVTKHLAYDPSNNKDFASQQYGGEAVRYDPTLAKTYWNKGLKQIGKKKLAFNLIVANSDNVMKVSELIKSDAEKALPGLTINLRTVPQEDQYARQVSGNFDAIISGRGADFADPATFMEPMMSNNPMNYGRWSNPKFDDLINQSIYTNSSNTSVRWNKMLQAEKLIMQQQGITPLFQNYNVYLKRSYLHGITHNTTGSQWNYKYMYIKK